MKLLKAFFLEGKKGQLCDFESNERTTSNEHPKQGIMFAAMFAAIFTMMFMKTSSSTFGVNLVQGGDSSLGCYSSWLAGNGQVSVQCEMDSQSFGVEDRFIIGNDDKDCYMTQTIDITYARNYLLNPGGRVTITPQGSIQGLRHTYTAAA